MRSRLSPWSSRPLRHAQQREAAAVPLKSRFGSVAVAPKNHQLQVQACSAPPGRIATNRESTLGRSLARLQFRRLLQGFRYATQTWRPRRPVTQGSPVQAHGSKCACGLTGRSSGLPPARHLGREAASGIIRLAAQAPCRRQPLSFNVRPQMSGCLRRLSRNPKNNAVPARTGRAVRSRKTRRAAIEVALRLVRDSGKSTAATSPGLFSQTEALRH